MSEKMTNPPGAMEAVKAVYPAAFKLMKSVSDAARRIVPAPLVAAPIAGDYSSNPNSGHGHVFPRPDGNRARCGGPGLCNECSLDLAQAQKNSKAQATVVPIPEHLKAAPPVAEVVGPAIADLIAEVVKPPLVVSETAVRQLRPLLEELIRLRREVEGVGPKQTLDVERAEKWLDENYPNIEGKRRYIAQLLHDYSLTVIAPPPLTEGLTGAQMSYSNRVTSSLLMPGLQPGPTT